MVKHFRNVRGVTLTELMVAVAIMSIGILGFFGAFRYITISLHVSRARTLATNLAQEKVEALKNESYYELLITTASATDNSFTPGIVYDNGNYGAETISIGGITFTRYTFVALAQIDNGAISTVTYTFPDTGMKQINVHVIWTQNGTRRKYSLSNLLENPNVSPLDSGLAGVIRYQGGAVFPGAIVRAQENPDYNTNSAEGTGAWSFRVYHGSYTIKVSSAGYYDAYSGVQSVNTGSNVTVPDIYMQAIGSGTIAGSAWYNKDLVISQVVASTAQAGENEWGVAFNNFQAEYIELFNPTTFPINIGVGNTPAITVNFDNAVGCSYPVRCTEGMGGIKLVYISTYVEPGHYYLIANTHTFVAGGQRVYVDAYYDDAADTNCVDPPDGNNWNEAVSPQRRHILNPDHGGTVWLSRDSVKIDAVGWSDAAQVAAGYETTVIPFDGLGFTAGTQIVRISSPTATLIEANQTTYGRAYDSNTNNEDFIYRPLSFTWVAPSTTTMTAVPVRTGKPAVGARVVASDLYSGAVSISAAYVSSGSLTLMHAPFSLVGVGTTPVAASCAGACWDVVIATAGYVFSYSTVAVQQNTITSLPYADSVPSWTIADHVYTQLSSTTVQGYVSGVVRDLNGSAVSGIQVTAGATTKTTGSNGFYFMQASTGSLTVIANPNNANTQYVQSLTYVTVQEGQISDANFTLARGGTLYGYLTSGTTPLPNFIVSAVMGGSQAGAGTSNTSGYFYIRNLSTGTYTVAPVLDVGQDTNPASWPGTISTAGSTVFVGTFTVSGAFGSIYGTVTNTGSLLTSGALILASTAAIPSTPVSIAASSGPAQTPLYAVSSKADGTYTLPVRGGLNYYVSAYVPTVSNAGTVSITTKTYSGIAVSPGATTTQNITIP